MHTKRRLFPVLCGLPLLFCMVPEISYGSEVQDEISEAFSDQGMRPKRSIPAISCPRDTYPFITQGKVKECAPGNATSSCPEGFICYFDGIDGRYICCGKITGYCEGGRPYLDPDTSEPQPCKAGTPNVCRNQYECIPKATGSEEGYCCLNMNNIEPPPVGCPWGTRPLKDANKQLIPCTPGMTNACLGGAICYYDSVERTHRCCGRDPGEGCPSGTRALKSNNQVVPCIPGDPQQKCPDKAVCQWSYLIDRFQCCQADDGCPVDSAPFFEPGANAVRSCRPSDQHKQPGPPSSACPTDYTCEFNFWTVSYQCCGKKAGLCPSGQVAYVEMATNLARNCVIGQASVCPAGFTCQVSTTGQGICCGIAGQCPAGSSPFTDTSGRLYACSPQVPNSCIRPATCQATTGGIPGQSICCMTLTGSGQCPLGYTMQNNQVIPCNPSSPAACTGSSCMQSPSQPGLFLCCQFGGGPPATDDQVCPGGFRPQGSFPIPCVPSMVSSTCVPGAQCLPSPIRPMLFYCCTSYSMEASQCPPNYGLQDGTLTQCNPSNSICKPPAACVQSPSNPSLFICCTLGAAAAGQRCPAGFIRQDNQATQCDPVTFTPCQSNNFCVATTGGSPSHICCTSTVGPSFLQCPTNYSPQDGVPIQCSPQNPTVRCSPSATCMASPDQPLVSICCVPSTPSSGQCPSGYSLQNNIVSQCTTSFPTCVAGSQCLASPVNPSFFLCCTSASSTGSIAACPVTFSPPSSAPQVCSPSGSSNQCPGNSQCIQSQNQPGVYICCQPGGLSGQLLCPGNGQPAMTGSSVTFCSQGATPSTCPGGYACQPATNAPGVALCCTSGGLAPTCPGGAAPIPLAQVPGHYTFCTLTNPTCPAGATCQTATNMVNTHVCCSPASASTSYACPHDFTPLVDPTGLVTFCSAGSATCPPPSTCLQAANNPQFHICCQPFGQSAAQCPTPGSVPLYTGGVVQTCVGPSAGACPQAGYSCQQSSTNSQYICCSTGPPGGVQCANGLQIYQPGSITFFCNPALTQCPAQYDCMPSTLSGQHVCCSRSSTAWQCVSGRQPFPNTQNPLTCTPPSSICPSGTSCEQSSTPNQFICCASIAAVQQSKCPAGATPYLEGLTPRRCTGPSDLSCPAPYTCAPSDQPNVYICCQFSSSTTSTNLRCFNGAPAYIVPGTTEPQRCTIVAQNCPPSFSCQASTQLGVTVCCGSAQPNGLSCPDGTPALIQGAQPIICSNPGVFCPAAFACVQASSSPDVRICCAVSGSNAIGTGINPSQVCGPGQQPFYVNSQPQTCQIGSTQSCADGYICQQGAGGTYYCCQGPRCPSGVTLLETNGHPRFCNPASNSCPMGSTCQQSVNLPGNYICCMVSVSQTPALTRCIGRSTYMLPSGRPQMCTSTPSVCPAGTECSSFTTTNEMICCATTAAAVDSGIVPICPVGDPYRDPIKKQYHYCSDTNYACPEGFICKQAVNNLNQYVCCSGKGTCQKGWIPYLDRPSNLPVQCSPFDKNACKPPGPPYKCQQSTKPGEYLCCMESAIAWSTETRMAGFDNETIEIESSTSSPLSTPTSRWKKG